MDILFEQIQSDVSKHNWQSSGIILTMERCDSQTRIIKRNGDIVVGFFLDENEQNPQLTKIQIGGVELPDLTIKPGEFVYALDNTYVYPIVATQYTEMRIDVDSCDNLHVVYAIISDTNARQHLATHASVMRMNEKTFVVDGYVGYVKDVETFKANHHSNIIELPNMQIRLGNETI